MHIGYHFTNDRLRDGSPIPAVGEKLTYAGDIEICRSGLHWSEHPFDALMYAPGPLLHKVECSKPVESHADKHVSRERTILATIDATHLLRRFAADQALSVAHLWDMPDVVREYLTTLDEGLRSAAWSAADAARSAAWSAYSADAAADAARSAAYSADAAADAAWSAARSVAWSVAYSAADAAYSAARSAARLAARSAARGEFKKRVEVAFRGYN